MLDIHPWARSASAAAIVAAAFLATSLRDLLFLYAMVLAASAVTGVLREHLGFVFRLASPLLAALLLVWGVWLDASRVPDPGVSGWVYAWTTWLRFVCCAGVLQVCFLPLLRSPLRLKEYLATCRLPNWFAVLMMGAVVLLPEVRRRFFRVVDARRAQGHALRGAAGIRQLPLIVMPLVSSMLDSAVQRAELWSHRGLLTVDRTITERQTYSLANTLLCVVVGAGTLALAWASRKGAL